MTECRERPHRRSARFSLTNMEKQLGAQAGESKLHSRSCLHVQLRDQLPVPSSLRLASGTLVPSGEKGCPENSLACRQKFSENSHYPRASRQWWVSSRKLGSLLPLTACPLLCSCSNGTTMAHLTPSGCGQPGFPARPLTLGQQSSALAPSGASSRSGKSLTLAEPQFSQLHAGDTTHRSAGLV